MKHLFISYSRQDNVFVERLEQDLVAQGIETWRDRSSIPGGDDWYESIITGLDASYAMIAVITPSSDESRWVRREALYADQNGLTIIPVMPAPHRVPFHLIEKQPVDCSTYHDGLTQIVELVSALRQTLTVSLGHPGGQGGTLVESRPKAERDYLTFLLAESKADLRDALYVGLMAEQDENERPKPQAASPLAFGLDDEFGFERLRLEEVRGDQFDQPGQTIPDARVPLRDMHRVVLLGDPGAGKTTTLLQMAVDLAREALDDAAQPLPVFVPLRAFTGEMPFSQFVKSQMHNLQGDYERLSAEGRLVLLCDALNEMRRKASDGRDLAAEVRDNLGRSAEWVVSCRVRDYQEELTEIANVGKVRLKPLDPPRIYEVIKRRFSDAPEMGWDLWHAIRGSQGLLRAWETFQQAGKSEAFWLTYGWPKGMSGSGFVQWRKIHEDRRRMMHLCRNPYMTKMICRLFSVRGTLPDNRGALFASFVDELLKREEINCKATGTEWIDARIIHTALANIAYAMQRSETGTEITRAEAEQLLNEHFAPTADAASAEHNTALLFRLATSASLIDVGDTVRFTHQLLQEYFASVIMGIVMDAGDPASVFFSKENWWEPQGWEETAIILAGVRGDAIGVAHWLAPAHPELAYRVLSESGIEVEMRDVLQSSLLDAWKAQIHHPHPVGRAIAYRILGEQALDDRPGVGTVRLDTGYDLPDFLWCEVPEGDFGMGGGKPNSPVRRTKMPYTFWMSQYPLTYAQYRLFVDDGGYEQQAFWSKDSWAWKGERVNPDLVWDDPYWHISNHPVIGITWFEAMAYCQWLNHKIALIQQSGQDMTALGWSLPVNYSVRLPTSAEWEKAARGTDARIYPYGSKFVLENNNVAELNLGRTSAVGIFPEGASPYGLQDMAGNVWEWCLSGWKNSDDLTTIDLNVSNGSRSYKGGSWNADQAAAQTFIRFKQKPAQRSRKVGFRLCIGPHSF